MLTLVCPQCQASYELPQAHFGPAGKKVRCANCAHVWIAHDDAPISTDFEKLLMMAAEPEIHDEDIPAPEEPIITASPSFSEILAATEMPASPVLTATRISDQNEEPSRPKIISAKRLDQARAQNARNEGDYRLLKIARWGSMTAVVALVLVLTAGNRWVVEKIPGMLPVYQKNWP